MHRVSIRLWRMVTENELWSEKRAFSRFEAMIDLVLMAAEQEMAVVFRGAEYSIRRGEIITSEHDLAKRWRWSREKSRRFIHSLVNLKIITTQQKIHRFTKISICNYDSCDLPAPTEKPQKNHRKTTVSTFDFSGIVEAWNQFAGRHGLPEISPIKASDTRAANIRARMKDDPKFDFNTLLQKIEEQPFLLGENEKGWRIGFDWIVNKSNYRKIMERTYFKPGLQKVSIEEDVRRLRQKIEKDPY